MAFYQEWSRPISVNPTLLSQSIESGIDAFGYKSIEPEQLTAMKSVLRGEDVFVSVPIGFRQSLSCVRFLPTNSIRSDFLAIFSLQSGPM